MIKIWFASLTIPVLAAGILAGSCGQEETLTPTPAPTLIPVLVVLGEQGVNLSGYDKIELDESYIEVSSTFEDYGRENLIEKEGYWHLKVPKETDEAWVIIDLGSEIRLDVLAVRPRTGFLDQLWRGDAAVLEGSNDKNAWDPQVKLELDLDELNDQDWIAFVLPENIGSYRYYRLFITDPSFLSISGLEVYGEGGIPIVLGEQSIDLSSYGKIEFDESNLEVSSTFEHYGRENLIKEEGFWHVKVPKETDEAWVMIDLQSEMRLDVLAVRPRTGFLDQLWRGDAAVLEGSNDKNAWDPQVKLELDLDELNDQDWIAFVLPENIGSYRYYRLFITDPSFLSMSRLEVYGEGGMPMAETPGKGGIPVVTPE